MKRNKEYGYFFRRLIGRFHIAYNVFGNCFDGLCIEPRNAKPWTNKEGIVCYPSRLTVRLRWNHAETEFRWRGGLRFDWNSGHLARRFGEFHDTDFGGVYQLKLFGRHHIDL